jgi:restriction system protein
MARRSKTSPFEDLVFIASRLPWWVSLLLAVLSGVILHRYAISPPPVVKDPTQFADALTGQVFRSIALFAQYLIPAAFMFGAIGSVFGRMRRRKLHESVATATQPGKTLNGISWREFELVVGEAFRRQGFTVTETGGNGPDGGVDLILHRQGEKHLVQCKQWRATKVGVTVIREFFGVMAAEGAAGGFVVTAGQFTKEARDFANGRGIRLVEGEELSRWIAVKANTRTEPPINNALRPTPSINPQPSFPTCPLCQSPMVKRVAKRGANAGKNFWGCKNFPTCKNTMDIKY